MRTTAITSSPRRPPARAPELLSDGRLARRARGDFERVIGEFAFSARDVERRRARGDTVTEEPVGVWQASSFDSLFGLDMPVEAVAEMLPAELVPILRQALASKRVFAPIDHERSNEPGTTATGSRNPASRPVPATEHRPRSPSAG